MKMRSLKTRILAGSLGMAFLTFLSFTVIIGLIAHIAISNLAYTSLKYNAEKKAALISTRLEKTFTVVESFCALYPSARNYNNGGIRELVSTQLRLALIANPDIISLWGNWNPGSFDGQDARYANTQHSTRREFSIQVGTAKQTKFFRTNQAMMKKWPPKTGSQFPAGEKAGHA